ncbi:MAG TPA: DNA polymerase IV [Thermoanaerobaculia bacterium]|nr:DNA polymerase IV [Thermoanaerobaculia bacterium]
MAETRRILHCDMDCFYAAVHMRDDPSLAGRPVVIGGSPEGRGVVAAASYEARRFGVHSAMPSARAHRLCPGAVFLKPDFPRYRRESEAIFGLYRDFTEIIQTVALDEAYLDVTERLEPWGSATAIAREIRRRVRQERGLTVSIGVGPNRLVAKIASDFDKPDGLTVVPPEKVQTFLDPLPVRRLHGVGPATERVLNEMGVATVADLAGLPAETLRERFGRQGEVLHRFARGEDGRAVETSRERKSLGQEHTYERDLASLEAMAAELARLAELVATGLQRRGLVARTVTIKVRYGDFTTVTRSHTFPAATASAEEMARQAALLLQATEAASRPVRLLGVTASGLGQAGEDTPPQLALFP